MQAKGWSAPATSRRVLELIADLDWSRARLLDVGAGRGAFCKLVGDWLRAERGLEPGEHVLACDLHPASFEVPGIACDALGEDGTLPHPDDSFEAVVSLEVVEHVEDQFRFLRELARVTRPGGLVVVTTPNVLSMQSRLRTLLTGFPELYDPIPLDGADVRLTTGHIHPISAYFLALVATRAGLVEPRFQVDRTKRSAALWTLALSPLLLVGALLHHRKVSRRRPQASEHSRGLLLELSGWSLLTGRTAILVARKPAPASSR
jgi:SAM-dependent methyltransferase